MVVRRTRRLILASSPTSTLQSIYSSRETSEADLSSLLQLRCGRVFEVPLRRVPPEGYRVLLCRECNPAFGRENFYGFGRRAHGSVPRQRISPSHRLKVGVLVCTQRPRGTAMMGVPSFGMKLQLLFKGSRTGVVRHSSNEKFGVMENSGRD